MNVKLVVGVVLLLGGVIFSVQNGEPVVVRFLFWEFGTSLALVLFCSVAGGALGAWAVSGALRFRRSVAKG